jgi:acyl-lipid omega-6 desaturase (Delta-12 desaturase)
MDDQTSSRKSILLAFETGGFWRQFLALGVDLALFAGGVALALLADSLWIKLLGSALATAGIVRLFLIGHDACHGSYFRVPVLNHIIGRIAFLPSMTAFSLWDVGHNVAHHGFNNLKGRDQVWAPMSKAEYDAASPFRRLCERFYRSGLGYGAYYFYELWWKKLYFATKRQIGAARARYRWDSVLVTVGALAWASVVVWVARETDQNVWLLLALGLLVPFGLWNGIMGFVVYVHHTHPGIAWFQRRQDWQRFRAYLTATANVRLPWGLDRLMHNIMEHNAHHLNPRIPMFSLRRAQQVLKDRFGSDFQSYRLGWVEFRDCVRQCKLYDFANHCWTDFNGRVTARVPLAAAPTQS